MTLDTKEEDATEESIGDHDDDDDGDVDFDDDNWWLLSYLLPWGL